jgi:hypothetical protein
MKSSKDAQINLNLPMLFSFAGSQLPNLHVLYPTVMWAMVVLELVVPGRSRKAKRGIGKRTSYGFEVLGVGLEVLLDVACVPRSEFVYQEIHFPSVPLSRREW